MRLTGGQIVVQTLIAEGVPYIVGIPGHGTLGLSDALLGQDRLRPIQVRHEQAAVHLADGYYRVTGTPLAVFTSIGPGAMNTVIGVASCYVDGIPVLVLTGNSHTHMAGRGVLQEIERRADADSLAVFAPITKRTWRPTSAARLPRILRRAFAEMLAGRRGPVAVDLPMDVQCDDVEVGAALAAPGAWRPSAAPLPDPACIAAASRLLAGARRPVIVAGGGVIAAGAGAELRALAELLGAPVVTTMMGKGAFPEDHPLAGFHGGSKGTTCGNALTRSADVLLAAGMRFADESTSSYRRGITYAIPPTRLIHLDLDPGEIGKNYAAEVGIVADARAGLAALAESLRAGGARPDRGAYLAEVARLRAEWLAQVREAASSGHTPVTISRLIAEVRGYLDRDAIVVTSSGNVQAQWFQEAMVYEPGTNLTAGGFSTMGWTVPAALGAKLGAPGRQVAGLVGDGDFLMTCQELATAVQYGIPAVYVVANNAGWLAIRDLQAAVYGEERAAGAEFLREGAPVTPDLAALARAFGCHGERVSAPDEVRPALERAFASRKPAVVEVMVERGYPLSGSPAAGWWDVPVPTYLPELRARYERERSEEQ
ncbi:MAG TPA: thiamine pyrophosphate-binding protein [Anaerolineae bacterium]|nr:thiamine pyrophosphate-binding protein [Anaerolineae bacterium]